MTRGLRAVREMYELTRGLGNLRVLLCPAWWGRWPRGLLNPVMPLYLQSRGLDLQGIGFVYSVARCCPSSAAGDGLAVGPLQPQGLRGGPVAGTSLLVPVMALVAHPLPLAAALSLKLLLARSAQPLNARWWRTSRR